MGNNFNKEQMYSHHHTGKSELDVDNHKIAKRILSEKMIPWRITLIYALVGGLWILLSDKFIHTITKDPDTLTNLATIKGWAFIVGTACMLFVLIKKDMAMVRKAREELYAKDEMYQLIIEGTTDCLWDWDIGSDRVFMTNHWKEKLGYAKRDILDSIKAWKDLIHPEDYVLVGRSVSEYLKKRISHFRVEYRIRMKNGEYIWVLAIGQGIWDKDGTPVRLVGTHTDISERKAIERSLKETMKQNRRLLNEAIEYDKLKTEFFANISHEFRTPLNVILGTIQLIDVYHKDSEKTCEHFHKITRFMGAMKQNCYRLLRLINNLIDITRIDSGFMQIQLENHNVVDVVEKATLSVVDYIESKSVALIFDTDVEEKIIACDADKIERVVLNLLSNALKYTKPGGTIWVNVFDQENQVQISVKDTGIGIPEEKLKSIFERFSQVNSSLTRDNEGSGIGLSLVKSLIEMHGGKVEAKSVLGEGSEFLILIPAITGQESNFNFNEPDKKLIERAEVEFSDIYL